MISKIHDHYTEEERDEIHDNVLTACNSLQRRVSGENKMPSYCTVLYCKDPVMSGTLERSIISDKSRMVILGLTRVLRERSEWLCQARREQLN